MPKRERTPAQIEAEARYAGKRTKKPVSIRLDEQEMAALDKARGRKSRAAFLMEALMGRLGK